MVPWFIRLQRSFFSIYDRYFYAELFPNLILGTVFFLVIVSLNQIYEISKLFFLHNVPFTHAVLMFLNILPFLFSFSLSFGTIPGYLVTMANFSRNYEIIAYQSCGVPLSRLFVPGIMVSVLLGIGGILFKDFVEMPQNKNYLLLQSKIFSQKPAVRLGDGGIVSVSSVDLSFSSNVSYPNVELMYNVTAVDRAQNKTIRANLALLSVDVENPEHYTLRFYKGTVFYRMPKPPDPGTNTEENPEDLFVLTAFRVMTVNTYVDLPAASDHVISTDITPSWQLFGTVRKELSNYYVYRASVKKLVRSAESNLTAIQESGPSNQLKYAEVKLSNARRQLDDYKRNYPYKNLVALNAKFSLPLSAFVFALLALPIGVFSQRTGRNESLGLSMLILGVYYTAKVAVETLVPKFGMSILWVWAPNVFFFILGLVLIVRKIRA